MRRKLSLLVAFATAFSSLALAGPALAITDIAGTVTDELTSEPLAGICVEVHDAAAEGTIEDSQLTDADGLYSFSGLTDIDYRLFFFEPGLVAGDCGTTVEAGTPAWTAEWNGGAATHATATNTTATEDAALTGTGTLDGSIFDDDGTTLLTCQVTVRLFDTSDSDELASDITTDGTYAFAGLAPGFIYALHFEPSTSGACAGKAAEWNGNINAVKEADTDPITTFIAEAAIAGPVTSTAAQAQTIDATLEEEASISGTVVNEISLDPLAGIAVRLHAAAAPTNGDSMLVTTDGTGAFTFTGLANDPSGYDIRFEGVAGYALEWWEDAVNDPGATDITVAPGADTDIGTADRHGPGHLFGTITDSVSNDPIDGVTVNVYSSDGLTLIDTTTTDPLGEYNIFVLTPDDYDIELSHADYATVTEDNFTINATVEDQTAGDDHSRTMVLADGSVTGTVTDADTSDPIVGATVTLYQDDGATLVATTSTDGSGDYSFNPVAAGTYDVLFTADDYDSLWYPAAASAVIGDLSVGAAEAVDADEQLSMTEQQIMGTLTEDGSGDPISAATVSLYSGTGTTLEATAATASDGTFSFTVVNGTYDLEFLAAGFTTEWFDDTTGATDAISASGGVDVVADAGLAAVVAGDGSISGTITDANSGLASSDGLAGIKVAAYQGTSEVASDVTAADGTYSIRSLSAGSYTVLADTGPATNPVGFFQEWYDNTPLLVEDDAASVAVGANQAVTGIDIALQPLFSDVANTNTFYENILWMQQTGVTTGCTTTEYCPSNSVTRAQMATFLVRALNLPATTTDYFSDDNGSTHEANINALREAGITLGCDSSGTQYCPNDPVSRGQMAGFLNRALPDLG